MNNVPVQPDDDAIAAVRRFSRFYTRQVGLLDEGLLKSEFSLTEARVLYELAHHDAATASDLRGELGLDAGYLSRILKRFERRGFVERHVAPHDGRQALLALTDAGRAAFEPLDRASQHDVCSMLRRLTRADAAALVHAMRTIECLMGETEVSPDPFVLRSHQLGDLGWITHRQALLYASELGWDESFEIMLAEIMAGMAKTFDPRWERSWIAERDGAVVGSVFLVRVSDSVAKLRVLYVEPSARGLGIGRRLVAECIRYARANGYARLTLWTHDVLLAARRIYHAAGFTCIAAQPCHSFGKAMVSETWELAL